MTTLTYLIPIEAIQERDIDLLILEELKCNPGFVQWMVGETCGNGVAIDFIGAWHSLCQENLGESDLVFQVRMGVEDVLIYIENKINAGLQNLQAERYRQRGDVSVRNGVCTRYYTILIAPERYLAGKGGFDFTISYEAIEKWFLHQGDLGARGKYKA